MSHDIALPATEPKGPVEDAIDLSAPQRLRPDYFAPPQVVQGPLTSDSFTRVPFADLPLYIPGLTQNVVGFNGGINKAALDVHREKGLLCNLLPYLDMANNDFIELFCRDLLVPVDSYNITQDDVDQARMIPLYIPRTRLPDGPANPVFMRVTPVRGNAAETQRLNLKVDTVPPAGRNPTGSTLHNENLPLPVFPQKIIDYGVSEADAQKGVPITFKFYPDDDTQEPSTFRATRDRISLRINGIDPELPPLTEEQAAGREEITFTLSYGFWEKVRSGLHVCEYEVIDEVGNASLGWSPPLWLTVRLKDGAAPDLKKALILEAAGNILDHDQLDGRDATLLIETPSNDYAQGDIIRVTVKGRTDSGIITTTYDSPPLIPLNFITLALPNADLRPFISGQFQLLYELIRGTPPYRQSETIIVDVTGTPIVRRLPPPVVLEASGGILDPQSLFVNVVVRAYPELGQAPSDRVNLILEGTKANGDHVYYELNDSAGTGDVLFTINNGPNGKIASLEGGTLRLRYNVVNKDGTRPSDDVTLNVGDIVASMPEPLVVEAPAPLYQFDPEKHTGNARILVKSNTDFLLNDTVTLHCKGTAPGGSAPDKPFLIEPQWLGIDLPFTLERQYITANLNKTMRIYYTRKRGDQTRISHEVNMKVGSRLELKAPSVLEATVTGANQASLNPLHVLPPHRPVVTIRVVSDKFPPGSDIKVFIIGKPGVGTPDIPAKPATPEPGENYVSFTVPNAFVGAYLGGKCTVYYNLIEIGKTTKSDELELSIQPLPEVEWDLVSIPEASGGEISAGEKNHVEIRAWHFMDKEQAVFIDLKGPPDWPLRQGRVVSAPELAAGRILEPIPSEYLNRLPNNSELTIKAYVSLDKRGEIISAQPFVEVNYRVRALGLSFVNGPYAVGPAGRVGDVQLLLGTNTKAPVAISLTLPAGFTFDDGTTGTKAFLSDEHGALTVEGIRSAGEVGTYELRANSGGYSARSEVNVKSLLPAGSVFNFRGSPSHIAITPNGLYAYVCVIDINRLVKVDLTTGSMKEIIIGGDQSAVSCSLDGKQVCVTTKSSLIIVETEKDEVTASIAISSSIFGLHIGTFSPDGKYLYTSIQGWYGDSNRLYAYKVDVSAEMKVREYIFGAFVTNALCSADGQHFYSNAYSSGLIYSTNIETGDSTVIGGLGGNNSNDLIISPDRTRLYSNNWVGTASSRLLVLNLQTSQSQSYTIPYPYCRVLTGNSNINRVLITSGSGTTKRVLINANTGATINTFNVSGYGGGQFSWAGDLLYLCEAENSRISVIAVN